MTGFKSERRRQKPLMERKRRARINKSLEQLKDVIVDNNGGILPRLDKARILELTVDYLQNKAVKGQTGAGDERFKAGYMRCANEVTSFLHDKVDDGKLTQIVQYLFTLTANIKHNVGKVKADKITNAKQFQTAVSLSIPSGKSVICPSTSTATLNIQQYSTTTCRTSKVDGIRDSSNINPSHLTMKDGRDPHVGNFSSTSTPVKDSTRDKVDTQRALHEYRLFSPPRASSSSTDLRNSRPCLTTYANRVNTVTQPKTSQSGLPNSLQTIVKGNGVPFGRTRRYGSVCSSTTSGKSSFDAEFSTDDEDVSITTRLPVQPYHNLAGKHWSAAYDNHNGASHDMSDSDDDSSASDVFYMDCVNDQCSDEDSDRIEQPCLDNEQPSPRREQFAIRHEPLQSGSDMWRPW